MKETLYTKLIFKIINYTTERTLICELKQICHNCHGFSACSVCDMTSEIVVQHNFWQRENVNIDCVVSTVIRNQGTSSGYLKMLYTTSELFTKSKFTEYQKIIHFLFRLVLGPEQKYSQNIGFY
jgi:hypothetical protein